MYRLSRSSLSSNRSIEPYGNRNVLFQIRVGGLQLSVLAGAGPRHPGPELVPPHPRAGPRPALPRPGRPRLDNTCVRRVYLTRPRQPASRISSPNS